MQEDHGNLTSASSTFFRNLSIGNSSSTQRCDHWLELKDVPIPPPILCDWPWKAYLKKNELGCFQLQQEQRRPLSHLNSKWGLGKGL